MKFRSVLNVENLGERIVPDANCVCQIPSAGDGQSYNTSTSISTVPPNNGSPPPLTTIVLPPYDVNNNPNCFTTWFEYHRQLELANQHAQTVWAIDEELRPLLLEISALRRELEREQLNPNPDQIRITSLEDSIVTKQMRAIELMVARNEAIRAHNDAIGLATIYWFALSVSPACNTLPIELLPLGDAPSGYDFERLST